MPDLVHLKHPGNGTSTRLPQHMVAAAEKNGFVRAKSKADKPKPTKPKSSEPEESDLAALNVPELKDRLRDQDLPTTGNKGDLVDRLEEAE